ncbi:prephenate dehydratase [Azonexus sp.]|uniref:prephenate dehydratase n=1 Tax=Azonexus sp. TaxID=1872668 RepID=UPI0035AEA613
MSDDLSKALAGVRADIDRIDGDILRLLNERARCAQRVGEIKAEFGDAGFIYRPEREAQVLRRLQEVNPGPLPNENITFFFREVMSACLSLEQPLGIACLGPLGSFTCAAATKHFGHAARLLPQASIDDAFREVESGHAHYVVAPIENSTEGAVGRTMDLLLSTPLKICGEVVLRIHQNLMTKAATLGEIAKVYSHAQSLAQCHEWLNHNLPGVPRISVASNSLAAQMAASEPGAAAIGGRAASEQAGVPLFVENIEDEPNNTTRFLILGKYDAGPSGRDKTSLIMSAPNRAGALHELLAPLSAAGVSMCRLESRPARNALWEYVYYVDVEGHREEPAVKAALVELAGNAAYLKILGSYPVAVF